MRLTRSFARSVSPTRPREIVSLASEQIAWLQWLNIIALKEDRLFKLKWGLWSYLCNTLRKTGAWKSARLSKILGCSVAAFAQHLEKQFAVGMSWKNRREWEIDHIVPLSTATTPAQGEALFPYTNMQPLWERANRTKGGRRLNMI